jgi:alkanesulfonate monooxygenase SsuD/methylene tetrahydromethanopterin reductase-like flavin-dependent oxidoreductase (luciferase family)
VVRLAVYGAPSQCVERARTLLEAGVSTPVFATVADDRTQIERIARHILPELAS